MLLFPTLLVSGFVVTLVLIVYCTFRVVKGKLQKIQQQLEQRFEQENVRLISEANFFGQESLSRGQMRGNGVLILTDQRLFFQMLLPSHEINIPIQNVVNVETVPSFKGKSVLKPLLQVAITPTDQMAWWVNGRLKWQEAIQKAIAERPSSVIEE